MWHGECVCVCACVCVCVRACLHVCMAYWEGSRVVAIELQYSHVESRVSDWLQLLSDWFPWTIFTAVQMSLWFEKCLAWSLLIVVQKIFMKWDHFYLSCVHLSVCLCMMCKCNVGLGCWGLSWLFDVVQGGCWHCAHVDDLHSPAFVVPSVTQLQTASPAQLLASAIPSETVQVSKLTVILSTSYISVFYKLP